VIEESDDWLEKRLSARERGEPEAQKRLLSEAALLEKLGLLGITPRLLAHGTDGRGPWHRVERIRMPTVAQRIEGGPSDRDWVERAAASTFRALAALHDASDEYGALAIVHSDLSPGNLAIDVPAERAVLLDFDLATWRERPAPRDGAFRGTIGYVAPEVARGETPTVRSDLFAAAASLLHALTGERPRPGDSFPALLAMAAEKPLQIPVGTPEILVRCLAFAPEDRPSSANEAACPDAPKR
jgi:serine/threonine protein kinase